MKRAFGPGDQRQNRMVEKVQQQVMMMYEQQRDFDDKQLLVVMEFPELENESQWNEFLRRPECPGVRHMKRKWVSNSSRLARTRKSSGTSGEDLVGTRTTTCETRGSDEGEICSNVEDRPTSDGW